MKMRISNGAMHHKYYSPHNLLCSAAWPSRACHCVPVVGGVLAEAGTAVPGSSVCSVPASVVDWGSTRHNTTVTMALKLITLALTALVLVQVGHGSCSHSNLQYSVRETSGLTTSQDAPVCGVWE